MGTLYAMSVSVKAARFGIFVIVGIGLVVVFSGSSVVGMAGDVGMVGDGGFIHGDTTLMEKKQDGTSTGSPPMKHLLWDVEYWVADRICTRNRRYAEHSGYWLKKSSFMDDTSGLRASGRQMTFHDSVSGLPLFKVPGTSRTWDAFIAESTKHGWPSFRDDEVVHNNVRVLPDGETVSITGTHLGHNLPDAKGNRFCINVACCAGRGS